MLRRVFLVAILLVVVAQNAIAVTPFARATAFINLDINKNTMSGVLWLDRDAVEVKNPIDKNGDVDYTDAELMLVRGPMTDYINNNLQIMWDGEVHPISPSDFAYAAHPVERNYGVRIRFNVNGYKAGKPVVIYSRLLNDLWRQAQTVVAVTLDGSTEVWSLGPGHYYDSRLSPAGAKATTSQPATVAAASRYGCEAMCLGVDSTLPMEKCPRCGGKVVSLFGAPIPGKGYVGPMGGVLMNFVPGAYKLEAVLVSKNELRIYPCTDALVVQPATTLSGKAQLFSAGTKAVNPPEELKRSDDGKYLYAPVPDTVSVPLQVRCTLNSAEFPGNRMVEFYIPVVAGMPAGK